MEVEFRRLVTFGVLMALAEWGHVRTLVGESYHFELAVNWISLEAAFDVAERFFVCRL